MKNLIFLKIVINQGILALLLTSVRVQALPLIIQ